MPRPTEPTPPMSPTPPSFPLDSQPTEDGDDTLQQADADELGTLDADDEPPVDETDADGVEIGEPVPEDDRTVRADQSEETSGDDDDETSVDPDPDPSTERH